MEQTLIIRRHDSIKGRRTKCMIYVIASSCLRRKERLEKCACDLLCLLWPTRRLAMPSFPIDLTANGESQCASVINPVTLLTVMEAG